LNIGKKHYRDANCKAVVKFYWKGKESLGITKESEFQPEGIKASFFVERAIYKLCGQMGEKNLVGLCRRG
jgi:hypothetical protein